MQQVEEHHLIIWKPWQCRQTACRFTSEFWKWGKICVTTKLMCQDAATIAANVIFSSHIGNKFVASHFQIHYDMMDTYVGAHAIFQPSEGPGNAHVCLLPISPEGHEEAHRM